MSCLRWGLSLFCSSLFRIKSLKSALMATALVMITVKVITLPKIVDFLLDMVTIPALKDKNLFGP